MKKKNVVEDGSVVRIVASSGRIAVYVENVYSSSGVGLYHKQHFRIQISKNLLHFQNTLFGFAVLLPSALASCLC